MHFIFALLVMVCISSTSYAQQSGDLILEAGKRIFTEVERQVIQEVLGQMGVGSNDDASEQDNDKKAKRHTRDDDYADKDKQKGKNKGMPPGLAKKAQLPPGLAKKDRLPPGLEKRGLPSEVTQRLPAPQPGTERVIVDRDVVLIEKGTDIVLDIIHDVILKP